MFYSVNHEFEADVKVFVVNSEYLADFVICKPDKKYRAGWKKKDISKRFGFATCRVRPRLTNFQRGHPNHSGLTRNFRIYTAGVAITIVAGVFCRLSAIEWGVIMVCFGMALAAEGFNTAIEILADRVCSCKDESIKHAKDVAAGVVLLTAFSSAFVEILIFINKLFHGIL